MSPRIFFLFILIAQNFIFVFSQNQNFATIGIINRDNFCQNDDEIERALSQGLPDNWKQSLNRYLSAIKGFTFKYTLTNILAYFFIKLFDKIYILSTYIRFCNPFRTDRPCM